MAYTAIGYTPGGGGGDPLRNLVFSADRRMVGDTLYSRAGEVPTSQVGVPVDLGTLIRVTVTFDAPDPVRAYVLEILVDDVVVDSLTITPGTIIGEKSPAVTVDGELSVRLRRITGSGPSTFTSHVVHLLIEGYTESIVGGAPPFYEFSPTIVAGSKPWPGGTVTATPVAPVGADSETYDWEIDAVSQGDADTSFDVLAGVDSGTLEFVQQATNGAGSVEVSATVPLEALRGITRTSTTGSNIPGSSNVASIPGEGSIVLQWIGVATSMGAAGPIVISTGRQLGGTSGRWGFYVRAREDIAQWEVVYYVSGTSYWCRADADGSMLDGTTLHTAVMTWDTLAGATVHTTLGSDSNAQAVDTAGSSDPWILFSRRDTSTTDGSAGMLDAVSVSRILSAGEIATALASDSPVDDLLDDPDLFFSTRAPTLAEGDTITASNFGISPTAANWLIYTPTGANIANIAGGINEVTT